MNSSATSNMESRKSQACFAPISVVSRSIPDVVASRAISEVLNEDDISVAISQFVLEVCNRQLRQYHLSALSEDTLNLNIGQGVDYSVDISRTNEGDLVAVKHRKLDTEITSNSTPDQSPAMTRRIWKILKEIQIMTHPSCDECPNVLSVHGYGRTYAEGSTTTPALVVEFANLGNLRQYLQTGETQSESKKWQILSGIIEGVLALHHSGIIHGDLKLENVLVAETADGDNIPKIADFGSSIITASEERQVYWGTDIYNPPEVRASGSWRPTMDYQQLMWCDAWAFGLLSLEVFLDGQIYLDADVERCFYLPNMQGFEEASLSRLARIALEDSTMKQRLTAIVVATLKRDPPERYTSFDITNLILESEIRASPRKSATLLQADTQKRGIIDLTDNATMRAILKGRGGLIFSPEKLPWSVQVQIAERYKRLSNVEDNLVSGFAHINLAICFYLGLGVERDSELVAEHVHVSALQGTPEAQLIIHPLSEFLGFPLRLEELKLVYKDEEMRLLIEARGRTPYYRPPFTELLRVRSKKVATLDIELEDLHSLVAFDNFEAATKLIHSGASDHRNYEGQTALLLACQNGNFRMAKVLLEHGSDASVADKSGITPLHMLCMFPDDEIVPFCNLVKVCGSLGSVQIEALSTGSWPLPEYWDELRGTPLQWAVAAANSRAVEALLDLGADPNNGSGWLTPIQMASSLLLADILKLLMNKSTLNHADSHGLFFLNESHPFRQIMIHGKNLPAAVQSTIEQLSFDEGVDIVTTWGETPLMKLAMSNISSTDVIIAQELLKTCDVTKNGPRFSTIQAAIMGCNGSPSKTLCQITLLLIDAGFSARIVSAEDTSWPGWNAMHWAAAGRSLDIVKRLHSADPELLNVQTEFETKDFPLHIAAQASYGLEMVKLLLDLGADPCAEAGYGQTPLLNCIGESRLHLDMDKFELLLRHNAVNGYIIQNNGLTIVHHVALRAAKLDQESLPGYELLAYILTRPESKALVNRKNREGITPLHLVCYRPDYSAAKLLVEAGADIHCMTAGPNSMSPLGIVLEIARIPAEGWAGKDLSVVWHKFAYHTACYLNDYAAGSIQDKRLTRLHIAAYCGFVEEVERLIEQGANVAAHNARGFTPRDMLAGLLLRYHQAQLILNEGYAQRSAQILTFLDSQRARVTAGIMEASTSEV